MNNRPAVELNAQDYVNLFMNTMVQVITNPVGFYRTMAKEGGFVEPLIFMVVMGVIAGIIRTLFGVLGLGFTGSFLMASASIIIVPFVVAIFGFVGAAILFGIWKLMGSQESFETAYRCGAYVAAITPITAILNPIPYVGPVIGIAWMTYLMVVASMEVHGITPKMAWIVFGAICVVLALSSISSQFAARSFTSKMDKLDKQMGKIDQMSPEEAGKKVGEFLKGMQEGAGKAK
jgi:hypothetical protein